MCTALCVDPSSPDSGMTTMPNFPQKHSSHDVSSNDFYEMNSKNLRKTSKNSPQLPRKKRTRKHWLVFLAKQQIECSTVWMLKLQMHFARHSLNSKISDERNLIKRIINSRDFSGSTCGGIIEKVSLRNTCQLIRCSFEEFPAQCCFNFPDWVMTFEFYA